MSDLKNKNGLNTWQLMRQLDDPELQKELDETELSVIKNRNFKYDKYVGAFVNKFSNMMSSVVFIVLGSIFSSIAAPGFTKLLFEVLGAVGIFFVWTFFNAVWKGLAYVS